GFLLTAHCTVPRKNFSRELAWPGTYQETANQYCGPATEFSTAGRICCLRSGRLPTTEFSSSAYFVTPVSPLPALARPPNRRPGPASKRYRLREVFLPGPRCASSVRTMPTPESTRRTFSSSSRLPAIFLYILTLPTRKAST